MFTTSSISAFDTKMTKQIINNKAVKYSSDFFGKEFQHQKRILRYMYIKIAYYVWK